MFKLFPLIAILPCLAQMPTENPDTTPDVDRGNNVVAPEIENFKSPDGVTVPKAEKIDEDRIKIGSVEVNHKKRTISFEGYANLSKGIVEYICSLPNGKIHESLFVTAADPLHANVGMKLLKFKGFEKFFPERDENFEWLPFTEPKPEQYEDCYLNVEVTYEKDGKTHTVDLADLVVNSRNKEPIDTTSWLNTGSFFYEGVYQASFTGEMISIFASRTSPINYIGEFNNGVNDDGWIVNESKMLPLGTKVKFTISQAPVRKPTPETKKN